MNLYNIEVGKRLRKARKEKRLSMKLLGNLVGLHESTISRYEKGEINALDIDILKAFAKVLEVSPMYLMGYEDPRPQRIQKSMSLEEFANEFDIDVEKVEPIFELVKIWKDEIGIYNLNENEMKELLNYAKFIISKRRQTKREKQQFN